MVTLGRGKVIAIGAVILALFGLQTWGFVSSRHSLENQLASLQQEIRSVQEGNDAKVSELTSDLQSDLQVVSEKIGVTSKDLVDARRVADQLKREQAKTAAGLRDELQTHSEAVSELRQEASQLAQGQDEAVSRIGAVSGDVQGVKGDLNSTKNDLAASRKEMGDIRDSLGREIARNSGEVAELRRRGEREYFEFNIPKAKAMEHVANSVQIQLKRADPKAQRYDVALVVDDSKMEKKNQLAKEPIQFLVGRDRLRYEMVVYAVDKDRIRGYVSVPKDATLSAEGPKLR